MASVTCAVVKGDTPIDIVWKLNNNRISTNDGILIMRGGQRNSLLSIDLVNSRHAGNYTCIAKNTAGIVQHSTELFVNGSIIFLYIYNFLFFCDSQSITTYFTI